MALTGPAGGAANQGGSWFYATYLAGRRRDALTQQESAEYESRAVQELGEDCAHWLMTGERSD